MFRNHLPHSCHVFNIKWIPQSTQNIFATEGHHSYVKTGSNTCQVQTRSAIKRRRPSQAVSPEQPRGPPSQIAAHRGQARPHLRPALALASAFSISPRPQVGPFLPARAASAKARRLARNDDDDNAVGMGITNGRDDTAQLQSSLPCPGLLRLRLRRTLLGIRR